MFVKHPFKALWGLGVVWLGSRVVKDFGDAGSRACSKPT